MNIKTRLQIGKILTTLIPFICSILFILHSIFDFYNIESRLFSYLGGTSILIWIYFLFNSYLYGLCTHHRMFIYYLIAGNCISIIDTYYTIPITDIQYTLTFIIGFGIAVLLYGYLKYRDNKKAKIH